MFVEPWLQHALRTQLRLSRRVPLCYSTVLGTHNSGITLADGYGTLDPYFQKYFEWIKWAVSTLHQGWPSCSTLLRAVCCAALHCMRPMAI